MGFQAAWFVSSFDTFDLRSGPLRLFGVGMGSVWVEAET